MVRIQERLRTIGIERNSADAEHSPGAGIFLDESDIEGIARCLDVERCSALAQSRHRIDRQCRDRNAIPGYRVERRADSAEEGESFHEGRIDDACVRGDLVR